VLEAFFVRNTFSQLIIGLPTGFPASAAKINQIVRDSAITIIAVGK